MTDFNARLRRLSTPKFRRGASIAAFWVLIGILVLEVLQTYLVDVKHSSRLMAMIGTIWVHLGLK